LFDARTPTAWGEVKAYVEFDFSHANENVTENTTQGVTSGWAPRLRKVTERSAGCWSARRPACSMIPTPTPSWSILAGRGEHRAARAPQVKYTYQGPYGAVFTGGFENRFRECGPVRPGRYRHPCGADRRPCSVTGNTVANLPATTACIGNTAFSTR
jgi:hypothetical protein